MSVNPGFGGQSFIDSSLNKISDVAEMLSSTNKEIRLAVDGGINAENIRDAADAGANTFVAGSAIFSTSNYDATIKKMRLALS